MWNIEKIISKGDYNYALVRNHPNSTENNYVLHHRIIMENYLGRLLKKNEVVHHKDGNKKNNKLENLQLLSDEEHKRKHQLEQGRLFVKLKCPWCGKIFEKPHNNTHLSKGGTKTSCSKSCNGKFVRKKQMNNGLTIEMKQAISENVLDIYRKYKDNSEETN